LDLDGHTKVRYLERVLVALRSVLSYCNLKGINMHRGDKNNIYIFRSNVFLYKFIYLMHLKYKIH